MRYKPRREHYLKLFLIIIGITIGFICYFIYSEYRPLFGDLLLLANVLIIVFLYFVLFNNFSRDMSNYLSDLTRDIKQISNEQPLKIPSNSSPELNELYLAIESLKLDLNFQNRMNNSILKIVNILASNVDLDALLTNLLPEILDNSNSNWGAFYIYNKITEKLEVRESIGFSKKIYRELDIAIGEGFTGKAALSGKIEIIKDIPEDSAFTAKTVLGTLKPRNLLTLPIYNNEQLVGILVLASINEYANEQVQLMETVKPYLGFSISKGIEYDDAKRLYKESNFRNKLLEGMNYDLEKKVQERTDFLNNIEDYAITVMDKDGYITVWNKGAEIIRGFKQEEAINKHVTELYPKSEHGTVLRRLEVAAKEGTLVEYGWREKKDGTRYFADVAISATYNANGQVTGYTNITKDITAMKKLEQSIIYEKALSKKVIDNSTRAIALISLDGVILSTNELCANVLGVANTFDLIGNNISNFFADKKGFKRDFQNLINHSARAEWLIELKFKKNVIIKINAATLIDDTNDEISGVLLYFYSELS